MKKLNAYQIKLICAFLMLLDHITVFLPQSIGLGVHMMSRVVAPIFAYFVVEGLFYTRNLKKYNVRLWGAAIGMAVGNTVINSLYRSHGVYVYNNIFMTLASGLLMLTLIQRMKAVKQAGYSAGKLVMAALGMLTLVAMILGMSSEGGGVLIPFMLLSYMFRTKKKRRYIVYSILSVFLLVGSYVPYGDLKTTIEMMMYNCDWLFILVIPAMEMYNGQRGPNTKINKYFFYIFYPLHLWIIATLQFWRV